MNSQIGRGHDDEARLREAMTLIESSLRDDPDLVMNLPDTAALYSDLAAVLAGQGQPAEARALFIRALDRLEQARTRAPRDARIRRMLGQTFARRAEFLRRIGQPQESLENWDRAPALAEDADVPVFRLGRATTQALLSDYQAALAEAAASDHSIDDRGSLRMTSALAHVAMSRAIRRDRSLGQDARALGVTAQVTAALGQIGQARRSPAYRDARRLYHRLADHDFEPLRDHPAFQLLLMDLAFPAQPLARGD